MSYMFEESVESFTSRWRKQAAHVYIFPRVENDPLLELEAAGVIFHALERTGPYLPSVGPGHVIVHALTEQADLLDDPATRMEVTGIAGARISGRITHVEAPFLVVDAGFPVVTGILAEDFSQYEVDGFVAFNVLPPLQAFVMVDSVRRVHDFEV